MKTLCILFVLLFLCSQVQTNKSVNDLKKQIDEEISNFVQRKSSFVLDEFLYFGEKDDDGVKHGFGILFSTNQTITQKLIENDLAKKDLVLLLQQYDHYIGNWKRGFRHGIGKLEQFTFDEDLNLIGKDIYIGDWRFDNQHGQGVLTTAEGDKYEGSWMKGQQDGKGTYYWISDGSNSNYNGDWRLGEPHGDGVWRNADIQHTGEWRNGKRHGKAKVINRKTKKVLFEGKFNNDKPVKE